MPEWKQRDVREGFVRNDLPLCPKAFDNVIDLDGVPVKDRIGDSAQATSGLSDFYLWVKTLETDAGICGCELPIYRLL